MKLFKCLTALFMVIALCSTVFGIETEETASPIIILGLLKIDNPVSTPLPFLNINDAPSSLILPDRIPCILAPPNDYEPYDCPVTWDLESLDVSTSGYKTLLGILSPEDGYQFGDGVSNQATFGVMVIDDSMEDQIITDITLEYNDHYVVPVGDDLTTLPLLDIDAICLTDNFGEYFTCPINWVLDTINTNVPGSYTVSGEPELPNGFSLQNDMSILTQIVGVVEPDCIDLSAPWIDPNNNSFIHCQWLYEPKSTEPPVLQYATVENEWHNDISTSDNPGISYYGVIDWDNMGLNINLESLDIQTDYWFRILYDNGRFSNFLHVFVEDDNFVYEIGGSGGDRDSGDEDGTDLPDIKQPAPEYDTNDDDDNNYSEENVEISPVLETVTKTSSTLSGARLKQLTEYSDTVLFEKQGVAIELSSAFLDSLQLGNQQLLKVSIHQPTPDSFSLAIYSNGKSITKLPETIVRMPYDIEYQPLECINQNNIYESEVIYEPENNTILCTISATGTYHIQPVTTTLIADELPPITESSTIPYTAFNPQPATSTVEQPDESQASEQELLTESHKGHWILISTPPLLCIWLLCGGYICG